MAGALEQSLQLGAHALAGSSAGVMAMALLYPLETIRCRLQVQKNPLQQRKGPETGSSRHDGENRGNSDQEKDKKKKDEEKSQAGNTRYQGSLHCLQVILREEGLSGLYRGLRSALVGVAMSSSVYFFWYQLLKRFLARPVSSRQGAPLVLSPLHNVLVASVAGALNVFCTIPFWVVNTRLMLNRDSANSSSHSIRGMTAQVYREGGLPAFYRGLIPSLILVSNPAIQFLVYDQIVNVLMKRNVFRGLKAREISALQYFWAGALAKAIATVFTYPYQVIKSRSQAEPVSVGEGRQTDTSPRHNTSTSTWNLTLQILREEGWTSLFAGLSAKLSQTVLNSAMMFVVYEKILRASLALLRWCLRAPATIQAVHVDL